MVIIEYTIEPHPLAAKAGVSPTVWRKHYRVKWWGLLLAWTAKTPHPLLGYISFREIIVTA